MTEKRFTRIVCSNDEYTGSLYCNDEPLKIDEVCKLLNELHEEKEEMQKKMNRLYNYFADFFSEEIGNNDFTEQWEYEFNDCETIKY